MARFRALTGLRSRPIGHNYRLVQLGYGRRVCERRPLDEAALEVSPQRDQQPATSVTSSALKLGPDPSTAALATAAALLWSALRGSGGIRVGG